MSRAWWAAGLLAAGAVAGRAQTPGERIAAARVRLARAEAAQAALARSDSDARAGESVRRRATPFNSEALTVLLPALTDDATGRRIVTGAAAMLDDIGGVPRDFIGTLVVVSDYAMDVDSVLRATGLRGRTRVRLDVGLQPDTLTDDWKVATAVGRAFVGSRDREWKEWLPWNAAIGWGMARDGQAAIRELMAGDTRVGAKCLAGDARSCRLWLGLDRDANPYAVRFSPVELRRAMATRFFGNVGQSLIKDCLDGTDDACVRAASRGDVLPAIPAGYEARASLLRAVRVLHGPSALGRALADTTGSLGDRLARAAGVGDDSLVTEWRAWLLTAGGQARVRVGAREAIPALLFGGLLLAAAAGSGRWR